MEGIAVVSLLADKRKSERFVFKAQGYSTVAQNSIFFSHTSQNLGKASC